MGAVAAVLVLAVAATAMAQEAASSSSLSLRAPAVRYSESGGMEGYLLSGPYFLRSADPEPPGDVEVKFIYGYHRQSDASDLELEVEWGLVEDWEFILNVPAVVGEGGVEGNGDATLGFHTRFWREDGMLPAFSVRNLLRFPTGYHGQEIDYTMRGLMTWSLDDSTRLHFNPYFSAVNDAAEDEDNFQWGAAIGFDHLVSDDLMVILDYQNVHSVDGDNVQSIEVGADWDVAEGRTIGFQFEVNLDEADDDYAAHISYIIEIDGPRIDG